MCLAGAMVLGHRFRRRMKLKDSRWVAVALASLAGFFGSVSSEAKPISRGNMPAYCRGEVAGMYSTRPIYVKTGQRLDVKMAPGPGIP